MSEISSSRGLVPPGGDPSSSGDRAAPASIGKPLASRVLVDVNLHAGSAAAPVREGGPEFPSPMTKEDLAALDQLVQQAPLEFQRRKVERLQGRLASLESQSRDLADQKAKLESDSRMSNLKFRREADELRDKKSHLELRQQLHEGLQEDEHIWAQLQHLTAVDPVFRSRDVQTYLLDSILQMKPGPAGRLRANQALFRLHSGLVGCGAPDFGRELSLLVHCQRFLQQDLPPVPGGDHFSVMRGQMSAIDPPLEGLASLRAAFDDESRDKTSVVHSLSAALRSRIEKAIDDKAAR